MNLNRKHLELLVTTVLGTEVPRYFNYLYSTDDPTPFIRTVGTAVAEAIKFAVSSATSNNWSTISKLILVLNHKEQT